MTKRKSKLEWDSPLSLDSPLELESVIGPIPRKPEPPPHYDPRIADFFEAARVLRRKKMSDADCWLDILHELRENAELRNIVYEHELRKARPRVWVLIRIWCLQWEQMELAMWATPPGPDQDGFKAEMALADEMIDRLSEPFLKMLRPQ
jgi:hypothetical protein